MPLCTNTENTDPSKLEKDSKKKTGLPKQKNPKNVKRGRAAKAKGKRRELEFAHLLKELGATSARRTEQYNGKAGDSDVVAEELPSFFIEVKGNETLVLWNAIKQACGDALKTGRVPMVAHIKSHQDWLITMRAGDWYRLAMAFESMIAKMADLLTVTESINENLPES